jgi:uncharacterized protein YhfF
VTWPRIDGLRVMEIGTPGEQRSRLNGLILAGRKKATAGLLSEYATEGEEIEQVGERLPLVDDDGKPVALLEITGVQIHRFADVPWEFAASEGEGDTSIEEWRDGHRRFFERVGTPVDDDSQIVCISFELVR